MELPRSSSLLVFMVFLGLLFLFVLFQLSRFDVPPDFDGLSETETVGERQSKQERSSARSNYQLQNRNLRMQIDRLERELNERSAAYDALQARFDELAAQNGNNGESGRGTSQRHESGANTESLATQQKLMQTITALQADVDRLKNEKAEVERRANEMTSLFGDMSQPSTESSTTSEATSAEASDLQGMLEEERLLRTVATESLIQLGSDAVPALVVLLRHERPSVREWSAYILGAIGRPAEAAVPSLMETLSDSDMTVRETARAALNAIERAR